MSKKTDNAATTETVEKKKRTTRNSIAKRDNVVVVRLNDAEYGHVTKLAEAEDRDLGTMVRRLAFQNVEIPKEQKTVEVPENQG